MSQSASYPHRPPAPQLSECGKWLRVSFDVPHVIKSWAVVGGGATHALAVIWRHVTDGELCVGLNPQTYLAEQIEAHYGPSEAPGEVTGFLTGVRLAGHTEAFFAHSGIWARCIATVGLNNALRIGDPPLSAAPYAGTINVLLQTSVPLTDLAAMEALSIVAEARTVAVLEGGIRSTAGSGFASGTGTDCIAIASPRESDTTIPLPYAGKHTLLGHLIGESAYEAVAMGVQNCKPRTSAAT
ncbi:MAG TPA: adenosylcobinamide amidohydrolase [Steroidobacteraceae bacterium]|jgi:adenosylcobinamide amidohydrolase